MTAYWINCYREITDQAKVDAYAALASSAIAEAGGTYLVRGAPAAVHEAGVDQRTVVVAFDSLDAALAAHATPAYQQALEALGDGAVRDLRIVPGTDET